MTESIAELIRMNYRIVFYPFVGTQAIAYEIKPYDADDVRILHGQVMPEYLDRRLKRIVESIQAGKFDELVKG